MFRASGISHRRHVIQNNAFNKHPKKHGGLPIFYQGVEKLAKQRLKNIDWYLNKWNTESSKTFF